MSEKKAGGLAGVVAGKTEISTVGKEGVGLTYRGYSIEDLAEHASFEEVAWLLLHGKLPSQQELDAFNGRLKKQREVPPALFSGLELLPATSHPMDVMRTACSVLGCLEPEKSFDRQYEVTERLLAIFPSALLYWFHFVRDGKRIQTTSDEPSIAGHFLKLLHGKSPLREHQRALDVGLILYAEHEFNASTFVARVTASTLSDLYSAITAGIGALRGPLHGGANEAAMELIERFANPKEAQAGILQALEKKEKIMGFGHRVYTVSDPRSNIIKRWAKRLSDEAGDERLYAISEVVEKVMWDQKKLFPNLDFYSATAFHLLGIATPLFTPIFVISRTAGWAAHVAEQRADNRLIRPTAEYVGLPPQKWTAIKER